MAELKKIFQQRLSDWDKELAASKDERVERIIYITPSEIEKIEKLKLETVLERFRNMRQYKDADIFLTEIPIDKMWFTQLYWIEKKVAELEQFFDACRQKYGKKLPYLFEVYGKGKVAVCIPPIVEQHEKKLVVIDGLHRVFCAHQGRKSPWKGEVYPSSVVCFLIRNVTEPLPCDAIPLYKMNSYVSKDYIPPSQKDRHKNLKREYFRDFVAVGLV